MVGFLWKHPWIFQDSDLRTQAPLAGFYSCNCHHESSWAATSTHLVTYIIEFIIVYMLYDFPKMLVYMVSIQFYIAIGSMYAIYGNIYHQYAPVMLAYIPAPWTLLWVLPFCKSSHIPICSNPFFTGHPGKIARILFQTSHVYPPTVLKVMALSENGIYPPNNHINIYI